MFDGRSQRAQGSGLRAHCKGLRLCNPKLQRRIGSELRAFTLRSQLCALRSELVILTICESW
jgi:hypothetical protein